MPHADDRTPGLANALFGPRLGRPVFVAARTSTPLPMSVTDPATTFRETVQLAWRAPAAASRRLGRCERCRSSPLFDLGFLEGHVLARDRIVFFEGQLL